MNRFHKSLIVILWTAFGTNLFLTFFLLDEVPDFNPLGIICCILAFPTFLANLFQYLFRKKSNPHKLQWIPATLNILLLICVLLVLGTTVDHLTGPQYQRAKEQRLIQSVVKKWIQENASYPNTYHSLQFERFGQITKLKTDSIEQVNSFDFNPIGPYLRPGKLYDPDKANDLEYAVYLVRHKFVLQSNTKKLYSVSAYFQLTPQLEVTNVRLLSEMEDEGRKEMIYQWRALFGNDNKNLELEKNGHGNSIYAYHFFLAETFTEGSTSLMRSSEIIPYTNGKKNGILRYEVSARGTTYLWPYKDDTLDGESYKYFDGKLTQRQYYKSGLRTGLSTEYYETGAIKSTGYYVRNEKVGEWKYWDKKGGLINTENWGRQEARDSLLH